MLVQNGISFFIAYFKNSEYGISNKGDYEFTGVDAKHNKS